MKATHFIYSITNTINGKLYIGQTNDPKRRWKDHLWLAKNKQEQYIHRAMSKYGVDNFIFEVIVSCFGKAAADEAEHTIITQNDSCNNDCGYNLKPGGATRSGFKFSEETKKKMKDDWKINHPPDSIRRTADANIGRQCSEERRQRISIANTGKDVPQKYRKGHSHTAEINAKRLAAIAKSYGSKDCSIPDCDRGGDHDGHKINGKRYCAMHTQRFNLTGRFDLRDRSEYKPLPPVTQETKDKISAAKKGCIPVNVTPFTADQLSQILSDPRGARVVAKEFGTSQTVILNLRKKHNVNMEDLYLKAYGTITAPRIVLNKPPPHSEERNKRHSEMMKGREPQNKTKLTTEQINIITTDARIGRLVAVDLGISYDVVKRIRREHAAQLSIVVKLQD